MENLIKIVLPALSLPLGLISQYGNDWPRGGPYKKMGKEKLMS